MIDREDRIKDCQTMDAILDKLIDSANLLSKSSGYHQTNVNLLDSELDREVTEAYLKACQDCRAIFESLKPVSNKLDADRGPIGFVNWLFRRWKTPNQPKRKALPAPVVVEA